MVTVTALRPFVYRGKSVSAGPLEMEPADALASARRGDVSLAKVLKPRAPEPPPVRTKRAYRRRDMQAEQTVAMTPESGE